MAGLLIIAHAPLASSLKTVVEHVFPNDSGIEAIDVAGEASPDDVERAARGAMARIGERDLLVLTDVFGATPCNAASRLADDVNVRVVVGVNVPMVWRAVTYRNVPLGALVERAVDGAVQGIMQVRPSRSQVEASRSVDDDQDRIDDQ